MKMERWVDGLSGRHDGLGDKLTSIDTYQIPVADQKRARSLVLHRSHTPLAPGGSRVYVYRKRSTSRCSRSNNEVRSRGSD